MRKINTKGFTYSIVYNVYYESKKNAGALLHLPRTNETIHNKETRKIVHTHGCDSRRYDELRICSENELPRVYLPGMPASEC